MCIHEGEQHPKMNSCFKSWETGVCLECSRKWVWEEQSECGKHQSSVAAVTHYHKLVAWNRNWPSPHFESQKSEIKVLAGLHALSGASGGKPVLCLPQLLVAANLPWFGTTPFLPLPPWSLNASSALCNPPLHHPYKDICQWICGPPWKCPHFKIPNLISSAKTPFQVR